MINWSDDPCPLERAESLSAWRKPVDEGSNPSAPTSKHSQHNRPFAKSMRFSCTRGGLVCEPDVRVVSEDTSTDIVDSSFARLMHKLILT